MSNAKSVFKDPDIATPLFTIYDKYVVVPADKTQNNIVLAKPITSNIYYQGRHRKNAVIRTYTATRLFKEEILETHKSVLSFLVS